MTQPAEYTRTVIVDAEVDGVLSDVTIKRERVIVVEPVTSAGRQAAIDRADVVVDANGSALLPGLHDHHIHLLATAASLDSVDLEGLDRSEMVVQLRRRDAELAPDRWLRAVGHHESHHGTLDRAMLDAIVADRPVRVQHASGAMWVLNTRALRALPLDPPGAEIGDYGMPNGRLHRADDWLRRHLPSPTAPDLGAVGARLASRGVTGVTDMSPFTTLDSFDLLAGACRRDAVPQHVVVSGGPGLAAAAFASPLVTGPVKIVLDEGRLPDIDELTGLVRRAHGAGRPVAVHCVGRTALVVVLAVLAETGSTVHDRIEHASVVPPDLIDQLVRSAVTVVTQPGFLPRRGDRFLDDVDAVDRDHLWPCARLVDAGVPVGAGTDAPYGPDDPWVAIAAAADRRARSGRRVGTDEPVSSRRALELFLAPLDRPGGPARRVVAGAPADLCLLDRRLDAALVDPPSTTVAVTWVGGRIVHDQR